LIEVSFDLSSKEYNGKYYTNANMINFTKIGGSNSPIKEEPFMPPSNDLDDSLPF